MKTFASDNAAGVHPEIMKAVHDANRGHELAYGHDPYTLRAVEKFRGYFGPDAGVYFVFGGTGANVVGLSAALGEYDSFDPHLVVCADGAHIHESEEGAPGAFTGCRILPVETEDGKLTAKYIDRHLIKSDMHGVISIAQPTEYGTVYKPSELAELSDYAHSRGFKMHVDGARICNAAAYLHEDFRTAATGADVLSFGGTKNGMMYGEAVIVLEPNLNSKVPKKRIRAAQRSSKMRYIAAQFDAMLTDNLWYQNAEHANRMAQILYHRVSSIPGVRVTQPVESNAVFAVIPREWIKPLQDKYFFHPWDENTGEVRWMCAWDTTEDDVYDFELALRKIAGEDVAKTGI